MSETFVFGNKRYHSTLSVGNGCGIRLLANIGHMDDALSFDDELRKAEIAKINGVDILADNTITGKSMFFKKWIKENLQMMLNTVPVYDCFEQMEDGTFEYESLEDAVYQHIDIGSDMIVLHPTMTYDLAKKVRQSNRIIKVTSRGGSQMYRYILRYQKENPYYQNWDKICKIISGTGVSIAIGLSLRSGSILDGMDALFMEELDIAGNLIKHALTYNIPVVVEGIGHVKMTDMEMLISEVNRKCHNVPVKTLGPLLSDRMIGKEHINSLLGSLCAANAGASIIGALFRSEHLGLPSVDDYEESLSNYRMLKYFLNMSEIDLDKERRISEARSEKNWKCVLDNSYFTDTAVNLFHYRNGEHMPDTCTMCGDRCAMKKV